MPSRKLPVPKKGERTSTLIDAVVTPGAKSNRIDNPANGSWQIRVSEPPREGRANRAITALLAKHLGIPKSRVNVTRGHKSRRKVILIEGLTAAGVERILTAAAAE